MLEHVPAWLGRALSGARAGTEKLAAGRPDLGPDLAALTLVSTAFADGARLPERFTADGEGSSPPLLWQDPPAGTDRLVLLVEDADAPAPQPLVHAVVWGLPAAAGSLAEGAISQGDATSGVRIGHNSFGRRGWLPPDPPTGHGQHRYVFQLFAIGPGADDPGEDPGRGAVLDAIAGHVLGVGVLVGIYSRGEESPVGLVVATSPA